MHSSDDGEAVGEWTQLRVVTVYCEVGQYTRDDGAQTVGEGGIGKRTQHDLCKRIGSERKGWLRRRYARAGHSTDWVADVA